ncbi:hypothetical protein BGW80DRAFT_621863 [Lactifluus volemus]|nr:hypothetical protein BGW80DRAFT_621863 [Lactifluus volemus]
MKRCCFTRCLACANQVVLLGLRACSGYYLTLRVGMNRVWDVDGSGRLCCGAMYCSISYLRKFFSGYSHRHIVMMGTSS